MLNKSNGYWVTSLEKLRDPIIANRWRAVFDTKSLPGYSDSDKISLVVKEIDFPGLKMVQDSIFYMGFEKKLPTSVDNAGVITLSVLETEDLVGKNLFHLWNQSIVNGDSFSNNMIDGESGIFAQNDMNTQYKLNHFDNNNGYTNRNPLKLEMYSANSGKVVIQVLFINLYPIEISSVKLSHESKELFKYTVSLSYDSIRFISLDKTQTYHKRRL